MKKAFTLAEILIVLFILGLVSLLTVPSLMDMYKFKVYSAQFNRVFSQLNTAFSQLTQDEMANSQTSIKAAEGLYATKFAHINLSRHDTYANFLKDYMSATSIYDGTEFTNVNGDPYIVYHWAYPDIEYMNLNGDASKTYARFSLPRDLRLFSSNQGACGKLPQGATVCVGYTTGDSSGSRVHVTPTESISLENGVYTKTNLNSIDRGAILVWLDTNGRKEPNVVGYDFFVMQVNTDGSLSEVYICDNCPAGDAEHPWSNPTTYRVHTTKSSDCGLVGASSPGGNLQKAQRAFGCLSRVLENGGKVTKFRR